MSDHDRTLQAWVDGEQFVFHDEEIDEVLRVGCEAATTDEAWRALAALDRELHADIYEELADE